MKNIATVSKIAAENTCKVVYTLEITGEEKELLKKLIGNFKKHIMLIPSFSPSVSNAYNTVSSTP